MLRDLFNDNQDPEHWKARARRIMLDLDARIDFGLYLARTWGRELYERYTVVMDRFHVAGWRRWTLVEPISEGLTLGAGGLVLMLALALPACRRRRAGRVSAVAAARQEPVPLERAHHRAQGQGGIPGAVARVPAAEERDPQALSRPRLSRRRHLRGGRGRAVLLQQVGARGD